MATLSTDYTDDVFTGSRKYKMTENSDGSVSFEDTTEYTTEGSYFGAADINATNKIVNELYDEELPELKKSVSDGKALIAAAITTKKVSTASDDTFATMAAKIKAIVLGSGNATVSDVLYGKTFTNDGGVELTGTMANIGAIDTAKSATRVTSGTSGSGLYIRMSSGAHITNASSGYPEVYLSDSAAASAASLIAEKLAKGISVLGITGTYTGVGTATAAQVLSGYTFSNSSSSGISGTMIDRNSIDSDIGGLNSSYPSYPVTKATSITLTLPTNQSSNWLVMHPPSGYYNSQNNVGMPQANVASAISLTAAKLGYGKTCLGITGTYKPTVKQIAANAWFGFGDTEADSLSETASYTCPAAGTCYYNGVSASYKMYATVTCEIYKNGTLVNSRNIDSTNQYKWRATMVNLSFSVASGDVIKLVASVTQTTGLTYSRMAHIDATIVTYG